MSAASSSSSSSAFGKDPEFLMWGFHVHQDLTPATEHHLFEALQKQASAAAFVTAHGIECDVIASFKPGYGPHLNYAWEVRVESSPRDQVLRKYGAGLLWMALNHGTVVSGYVHPTMHDESLPGIQQLLQEGVHHKFHSIVFGRHPVNLKLDFFNHPALTSTGGIVDTRSVNQYTDAEVETLRSNAPPYVSIDPLADPSLVPRVTLRFTSCNATPLKPLSEQLTNYLAAKGLDAAIEDVAWPDADTFVLRLKGSATNAWCLPHAFGAAAAWAFCNRLVDDVFTTATYFRLDGVVEVNSGVGEVPFAMGLTD